MQDANGFFLPDDEEGMLRWAVRPGWRYQSNKLHAALTLCRKRRLALDIGAHCGTWSIEMVRKFDRVIAFEPLEKHVECFKSNVPEATIHQVVLGDREGTVGIHIVPKAGACSWVEGEGEYPMKRLDDYDLSPDFIKIDTEGFELDVLKGGEKTILRSMPVIVVEQKPGNALKYGHGETEAVDWLEERGYLVAAELVGDFIMVPKVIRINGGI